MGSAARRAAWAFAVLAGTAGIAWLLAPEPEAPATVEVTRLPPIQIQPAPLPPLQAASQADAAGEGVTMTHGDPGKLFADAVRRAKDAPQPPPAKEIAEARTFQDAFAAMQKVERERASKDAAASSMSPFQNR